MSSYQVHNHGYDWCPERQLPDGTVRGACLPDPAPLVCQDCGHYRESPNHEPGCATGRATALAERELEPMGSE